MGIIAVLSFALSLFNFTKIIYDILAAHMFDAYCIQCFFFPRLITITGSPMEAQTAQFLISKKIELEGQNTAAPPRPSRKNRAT